LIFVLRVSPDKIEKLFGVSSVISNSIGFVVKAKDPKELINSSLLLITGSEFFEYEWQIKPNIIIFGIYYKKI